MISIINEQEIQYIPRVYLTFAEHPSGLASGCSVPVLEHPSEYSIPVALERRSELNEAGVHSGYG